MNRICEVCRIGFSASAARVRTGRGKYCSVRCKGLVSRISANCEQCGETFKPNFNNQGTRQRFCSKACSGAARSFRRMVPCAVCGLPTLEPRRFCSVACSNTHQSRGKLAFNCKTCGVEFRWSASRVAQSNPTYCSVPCRTACPDWRRNAAIEGNLVQTRRKSPSGLELAGNRMLRATSIEFNEQVLIESRFLVDVYIPSAKIVVQWDGDYWHGYRAAGDVRPLDKRQLRRVTYDRSQDAFMTKRGLMVLRFWEHEVKQHPDAVRRTIEIAIARRMELAVQPTKRAAVAKTKNKIENTVGLPLFGGEPDS